MGLTLFKTQLPYFTFVIHAINRINFVKRDISMRKMNCLLTARDGDSDTDYYSVASNEDTESEDILEEVKVEEASEHELEELAVGFSEFKQERMRIKIL